MEYYFLLNKSLHHIIYLLGRNKDDEIFYSSLCVKLIKKFIENIIFLVSILNYIGTLFEQPFVAFFSFWISSFKFIPAPSYIASAISFPQVSDNLNCFTE